MTETLFRIFKGDTGAVDFANVLWSAIQEWDDLHDEGKCQNHNALLSWLAFGKEYTPFFAAHSHIMRPALLQMYLGWQTANTLERGSRDDVNKAYMLRAGYYQVLHMMAWIIGGDLWAAEVGPEIYRLYDETADGLWAEMNEGANNA